jgi:enediyne biosynthesis protein E4
MGAWRRGSSHVLSRRRRGVLTTGVVAMLALGLVTATALYERAPARYDPSASAEGITSGLARTAPVNAPPVRFTDVAAAAGVTLRHFPALRSTQLPEDMGSGAAWGDFDDDGDDDLFIANISGPLGAAAGGAGAAGTSRLYRNDGGRFTDVSEPAGLAISIYGMGAAWGDADGDGRLDLVVTAYEDLRLFRNRGDGTFEDRTARAGLDGITGFWTGASWADYDRDGDLDLYVCGYVRYRFEPSDAGKASTQSDAEVPYTLNPSSYSPERNLLFRNDGKGRFVEVGRAAGVDNIAGRSLAAAWCDFDDDGWLDLYVANDVSDNALFRNLGSGRFEDVSHTTWVADPRGAMGLAVGDFDVDGDFDIFVTHWLAQENALYSNMRIGSRGLAPGRLAFMDVADEQGVGQVSLDFVKWGTSFFDYDNDGRPDLLSINGSTFQDPDDTRRLIPMRHQLFWNRSNAAGFFEVAATAGPGLTAPSVGRGAAFSDYDLDGDVDVLVVNHGGPVRLLRNDGGNAKGWLSVRARGRRDRQGNGALVLVTAGGVTQRAQVGAQPSYLSQNSATLHFGLGDHDLVEEIVVRFPSGREVRRRDIAAGQTVTVEEPPS